MSGGLRRGRKAALDGPLARVGARGLKFAVATVNEYAAPPAWFDEIARDVYWTIVTDLGSAGELSRSDAVAIRMAASCAASWHALDRQIAKDGREVGENGFMTGLAQARAAAAKSYMRIAGTLGCTPAARIASSGALQATFLPTLDASLGDGGAPQGGRPRGGNIYQMRRR